MENQMQLVGLAAEINTLHDSAQNAALTAVQYAAKCGEKLIQAKSACAHGEWLPWLEANCAFSGRHATRYIKLANEMPSLANRTQGADFDSIKTAIAYLSASDEVKEQVDSTPDAVTEKQINELKRKESEAKKDANDWRMKFFDVKARAADLLENPPEPKIIEVVPDDYETTKRAAEKLAADVATANAEATRAKADTENLRAEMKSLAAQQSAEVKKGVARHLSDLDSKLKKTEASIAAAERREDEAYARANKAAAQVTAAEMRNKRLSAVKDKLIEISADMFDAFDGSETLTTDEFKQWDKVADMFQNGCDTLRQALDNVDEVA